MHACMYVCSGIDIKMQILQIVDAGCLCVKSEPWLLHEQTHRHDSTDSHIPHHLPAPTILTCFLQQHSEDCDSSSSPSRSRHQICIHDSISEPCSAVVTWVEPFKLRELDRAPNSAIQSKHASREIRVQGLGGGLHIPRICC